MQGTSRAHIYTGTSTLVYRRRRASEFSNQAALHTITILKPDSLGPNSVVITRIHAYTAAIWLTIPTRLPSVRFGLWTTSHHCPGCWQRQALQVYEQRVSKYVAKLADTNGFLSAQWSSLPKVNVPLLPSQFPQAPAGGKVSVRAQDGEGSQVMINAQRSNKDIALPFFQRDYPESTKPMIQSCYIGPFLVDGWTLRRSAYPRILQSCDAHHGFILILKLRDCHEDQSAIRSLLLNQVGF